MSANEGHPTPYRHGVIRRGRHCRLQRATQSADASHRQIGGGKWQELGRQVVGNWW